jgi:hypothetical protein
VISVSTAAGAFGSLLFSEALSYFGYARWNLSWLGNIATSANHHDIPQERWPARRARETSRKPPPPSYLRRNTYLIYTVDQG